jgi:hypothetical protein
MSFSNPLLCRDVVLSHEQTAVLSDQELMRQFKCPQRLETYTKSIQVLDMDDWDALRVKLCSDEDVSEVLFLLDCYVHAYKAKKEADDEFNFYIDNPDPGHSSGVRYTRELQEHWSWMQKLRQECEDAFLLSDEIFEELNELLKA